MTDLDIRQIIDKLYETADATDEELLALLQYEAEHRGEASTDTPAEAKTDTTTNADTTTDADADTDTPTEARTTTDPNSPSYQRTTDYLYERARSVSQRHYGNRVYARGLIEISNYCKNNCYYCGIRAGNGHASRYRLTKADILACCEKGYEIGFRTFVLQGGEDAYYDDETVCDIVGEIKSRYPDCAVTLSLGERSRDSYAALYEAGADRYLLRHETADAEHYGILHPNNMSWAMRMQCLKDLKDIGYQTGCGIMVGSPGQKLEHLVSDLRFMKEFQPQMVGIGPFLSQKDTPFGEEKNGSVQQTLWLLAIVRLLLPKVLLPATTALGTAAADGRELGILAGANVVMPNLSPEAVRAKYALYDNKLSTGAEAAESWRQLDEGFRKIGYELAVHRGDSLVGTLDKEI